METIGIICEYNPFHNGHLFHIQKIKEMYPDSILILVLNGYFLERGEISCLTKEVKTKIALSYGVDLVLELPVLYGTQSADQFAEAAVTILNAVHVQKIIFGSECNDISVLSKIVSYITKEEYQQKVKEGLQAGLNYPTALAKAIPYSFDFNNPNDLLAISYIKAIQKHKYPIEPISIQRTNSYHDLESTEQIISASNIRNKVKNKEDVSPYLPNNVLEQCLFFNSMQYFKFLKMKILTTPHLEQFLTVDEGIENRLIKAAQESHSLEELITKVKTKRYTYNKIERMFLHILLGITKEDNQNSTLSYIRILGFNEKGQTYLQTIKKHLSLPTTIDKNSIQYKYEIRASLLYDLIQKTHTYDFELQNKPVKKTLF